MSVSRISFPIGPVRADRPFYVHSCLTCGSRVMSDLLFSPAAVQHMCPNSDIREFSDNYDKWLDAAESDNSGYYDSWDEPEVPGMHFTHGDESDILDLCDNGCRNQYGLHQIGCPAAY